MNKRILICILFFFVCIAILAAGCLEKEFVRERQVATYQDVYEGESENWKAKFVQNVTEFTLPADDEILYYVDGEIILTYKGNLSELSSVQVIEYSYVRNSGEGGWTEANPHKRVYGGKFSYGGSLIDRSEAFNVIVGLDGKKETIEVKKIG
ncbi:MAG: hypothetical protein PHF18_11060 [Methanosarcina sp.]|uniref:hypothetical protein n=1 Tax=Methanosarcina sp. TaxID=2213 RepID=UPI00262C5842|nr:hypothetical protein [Methanosarcina sp.]MDD3247367.1 hypothetical protein [Methanosarcina sp.]